jgi:Zn-dependent protease
MDLRYRPVFSVFNWISNPNEVNAVMALISCFSAAVIIFMVFPIHEYAHALSAKLLGDDTAERQGRLTLNPLAHIDPMGAIMLLFLPFGWAKPVPVNPARCHKVKAKSAIALTALAGPAANIVLAYFFMVIRKLVIAFMTIEAGSAMVYLPMALSVVIQISLFLAVLNLLPVPPLDGSKILFFFNQRLMYKMIQYQQMIRLVFILLLFMPGSPIIMIISFFSDYIYAGLDFLSGFIG